MKGADYLPGFIVVSIIASLSYFVSTVHASFDPLVLSIIVGMFVGNILMPRDYFDPGVEGAMKIFMPLGIALYGTQVVFKGLGLGIIGLIFAVFLSQFILTLVAGSVFNINKKLSFLLASGLSICGASAIAILSPIIRARKVDTSLSIVSVMMLGLTGMIGYPILSDIFGLTNEEFNFLAGTTLPMIGQVRVAAMSACPDCVLSALEIKLIRVSFLVFIVTAAVFLGDKPERRVRFPWFIVLFLLLAAGVNMVDAMKPLAQICKGPCSLMLSAGLAAIGFTVDFDVIVEEGLTSLGILFVAWTMTVLTMFLVRNLF